MFSTTRGSLFTLSVATQSLSSANNEVSHCVQVMIQSFPVTSVESRSITRRPSLLLTWLKIHYEVNTLPLLMYDCALKQVNVGWFHSGHKLRPPAWKPSVCLSHPSTPPSSTLHGLSLALCFITWHCVLCLESCALDRAEQKDGKITCTQ